MTKEMSEDWPATIIKKLDLIDKDMLPTAKIIDGLRLIQNDERVDLHARGYAEAAADEIERMRAALERPITMQDIRLCAGEGKLATHTMLEATNAVLRQRVSHQQKGD